MRRQPPDMRDLRRQLVGDSIQREKLMKRFVQLVRADERQRVLSVTDRARQRAADR